MGLQKSSMVCGIFIKMSILLIRELDERNLKVELKSLKVVDKLEKAIDDTFQAGIEYKGLMVQGTDIWN